MQRDRPSCPVLVLPTKLESVLGSGHPWIYRDHVPRGFSEKSGTWVEVRAGKTVRYGLWDESSPIAIRVFSRHGIADAAFIRERVREAVEHRLRALPAETDAYRVLYGEGDGLPGITADRYGDYAVIVTYADCLSGLVDAVARALMSQLQLKGVLFRRSDEAKGSELVVLHGERPPKNLIISERGLKFYADVESGQKTGLFLDQRDNRHMLAPYVKSSTVLNLFSYTGGFSVVSAHYGATRVTSVDIAAPAIKRVEDNLELNGFDPKQHPSVAEDCYDYLARCVERAETFDVVICDPPSLARNRAQLEGALKAYTLLNARAIACTRLGGYLAAASCTSQVSPEAFRGVLADAARKSKRRLQLVCETGHAADHPQQVGHPEGRYLKFMLFRVLEQN